MKKKRKLYTDLKNIKMVFYSFSLILVFVELCK